MLSISVGSEQELVMKTNEHEISEIQLYWLIESIMGWNELQRVEDNPLFVLIHESIINAASLKIFNHHLDLSTIKDYMNLYAEDIGEHNDSIGAPAEEDSQARHQFYMKSKPYWKIEIIPKICEIYQGYATGERWGEVGYRCVDPPTMDDDCW